jgi:AAA family ATP:ADP antiporter
MGMDRPTRFPRLPGVKPGEEATALLFFFYFFLITAPFTIFKSIRDASYLDRLGSENLPLAYATTFFVGLVAASIARLQARVRRQSLIVATLIFFALTGVAFFFLFPRSGKWLALIYYVWANILAVVVMTQFWIAVNDVYNPREAKRLIGFIVSGGILGGILGGLLTYALADRWSYNLLWLGGALLCVVIPVVNRVYGQQRKRPAEAPPGPAPPSGRPAGQEKAGFRDGFRTVRQDRYLRLLAGIVLLSGLIATFIDWQSKHVIERTVRGSLTSFFGLFNSGLLIFSFLLQFLGTSRFVDRYGIRRILLLYPMIILACTLGLMAWPVLALAVALKGSEKSLSYSVNQSARELLYFPVASEQKYRAKVFIDMFLNRLSRTLGALLLLGVLALPGLHNLLKISFLSLLCLLAWIGLNFRAGSDYVRLIKEKLRGGWDRGDRLVEMQVDVGFAKTVFDLLESRRRSPILYALHVYDLVRQGKLTPELRAMLLAEPEDRRPAALGGLIESEAAGPLVQLFAGSEEETLARDVQEVMASDVYQEVMQGYLERVLDEGKSSDAVTRMEIAKMLGFLPRKSLLVRRLDDLLADDSAEVVRYAIESAGRSGRREFVPELVRRLGDARFRQDAAEALERYGARIEGTLSDRLADAHEPVELRKNMAAALGRVGNQEAVDFLLWQLGRDQGDVDDEIIDALDRIRSGPAKVRFDPALVLNKLEQEFKRYYRVFLAEAREDSDGGAVKAQGPDRPKTLDAVLLNIFKLLGLVYAHEDIFKAYQNWKSGTREAMAYALELLDNSLNTNIRDALFPILEDYPLRERVRRFRLLLNNLPEVRP